MLPPQIEHGTLIQISDFNPVQGTFFIMYSNCIKVFYIQRFSFIFWSLLGQSSGVLNILEY
jgi:hypothetical protein